MRDNDRVLIDKILDAWPLDGGNVGEVQPDRGDASVKLAAEEWERCKVSVDLISYDAISYNVRSVDLISSDAIRISEVQDMCNCHTYEHGK